MGEAQGWARRPWPRREAAVPPGTLLAERARTPRPALHRACRRLIMPVETVETVGRERARRVQEAVAPVPVAALDAIKTRPA